MSAAVDTAVQKARCYQPNGSLRLEAVFICCALHILLYSVIACNPACSASGAEAFVSEYLHVDQLHVMYGHGVTAPDGRNAVLP